MKSLIIPDIHNKFETAEKIIATETNVDEIVFTGDYFDDHGDDRRDALKTVTWLKESLEKTNRIHCIGNHDAYYLLAPEDKWHRAKKGNEWLMCSGNTTSKFNTIRYALEDYDFSALRLYYYTQGFFCSHAGLHPSLFVRPFVGLNKLEEDCKDALQKAKLGIYTEVLGAGRARGGRQNYGGLTWLDWVGEFEPIHGVNQIVGHSYSVAPRYKNLEDSVNLCLDTKLAHYALITDRKIEIKETTSIL